MIFIHGRIHARCYVIVITNMALLLYEERRMSEKRRDNKNRILLIGESQRSDGKYMYRYVDAKGKTQCLYSWKLVCTDTVPEGKKDNGALRDLVKQIQRKRDDDITPNGDGYTVLNLVKKYTSQKTGVKLTTQAGYGTVINLLKENSFGSKRIDKVKLSDAKAWLIKLQQEEHKSFSTIHSIRGVLGQYMKGTSRTLYIKDLQGSRDNLHSFYTA